MRMRFAWKFLLFDQPLLSGISPGPCPF